MPATTHRYRILALAASVAFTGAAYTQVPASSEVPVLVKPVPVDSGIVEAPLEVARIVDIYKAGLAAGVQNLHAAEGDVAICHAGWRAAKAQRATSGSAAVLDYYGCLAGPLAQRVTAWRAVAAHSLDLAEALGKVADKHGDMLAHIGEQGRFLGEREAAFQAQIAAGRVRLERVQSLLHAGRTLDEEQRWQAEMLLDDVWAASQQLQHQRALRSDLDRSARQIAGRQTWLVTLAGSTGRVIAHQAKNRVAIWETALESLQVLAPIAAMGANVETLNLGLGELTPVLIELDVLRSTPIPVLPQLEEIEIAPLRATGGDLRTLIDQVLEATAAQVEK